jgi:TorA maturation chaperone TorD
MNRMSPREKQDFCSLMAALFSPPVREVMGNELLDRISSFLEDYAAILGEDPGERTAFLTKAGGTPSFSDLKNEYERLFSDPAGKSVPLCESCYKPWTSDPGCHLSFSGGKGLLMGDSALHMKALFHHIGWQLPDELRGSQDHLVAELAFLSALYGGASESEARQFISDHLDWIPQLEEELIRFDAQPFYLSAIERLNFFLDEERQDLERKENGKKSLH